MKPVLLFLTCTNKTEADKISDVLLDKRLVVCIKKFPVSSDYLWKGQKNSANEVLLIMESEERLFEKIKKTVKTLHSYDMPVLLSIPITKAPTGIFNWFKKELK